MDPNPANFILEKTSALDFFKTSNDAIETEESQIDAAFECDENFSEDSFVRELLLTEETLSAIDALILTDSEDDSESWSSSENLSLSSSLDSQKINSLEEEDEKVVEERNNNLTSDLEVKKVSLVLETSQEVWI